MKKYISLALVALSMLTLVACHRKTVALGDPVMYEVTSDIRSLDIQINAADVSIVHGSRFSVESNLKNLSVSETNGVLTIEEKTKVGTTYTDAMLTLRIPDDIVFDTVKITTGAAKLTVDSLSADSLSLTLGAGEVWFGSLNAYSSIDMEGGTGEITIAAGTLQNLNMRIGVGAFRLTAALRGNSDLQFGVGEADLTLIGNPADYRLEVTEGIGSIHIDASSASDYSSGTGQNYVKIQGGIGEGNIRFRNGQ